MLADRAATLPPMPRSRPLPPWLVLLLGLGGLLLPGCGEDRGAARGAEAELEALFEKWDRALEGEGVADEELPDGEELLRWGRDALDWVAAQRGLDLDAIGLRQVERAELVEVLELELERQFAGLPDMQDAAALARAQAAGIGPALAAKYSWSRREILVCRQNLRGAVELLGDRALIEEPALRALMVHEAEHAADDVAHGLEELMLGCDSLAEIEVAGALIEGHAQMWARDLCAERGLEQGFETFTRATTALPEDADLDPGLRLMLEAAVAQFAFLYLDGEQFCRAVREARGEEGLALLFEEPPRNKMQVSRPAWYLDPESRPGPRADLDAGLDRIAERFPTGDWAHQRASLGRSELAAAMGMLPQERLDPVLDAVVACEALSVAEVGGDGSRHFLALLITFASPEEARAFLGLAKEVALLKDETMKSGMIRIVEAEYRDLEGGRLEGFEQIKRLRVGDQRLRVHGLEAAAGALAVECVASEIELDEGELVRLAERAVAAALGD